jgi:hypothetical protein
MVRGGHRGDRSAQMLGPKDLDELTAVLSSVASARQLPIDSVERISIARELMDAYARRDRTHFAETVERMKQQAT